MLSDSVIFTSYCFGDKYLEQQKRLKESILSIYPDANLHFVNEAEASGKQAFEQSYYGFKVRLIEHCLNAGYKKIIFVDTSVVLKGKVDSWLNIMSERGVMAPKDDRPLKQWIAESCVFFAGFPNSEPPLIGGSVYGFDFNVARARLVFELWQSMEKAGKFGNKYTMVKPEWQNHRMDESCLALAMAIYGVNPVEHDIMSYQIINPNAVALKQHFK